MPKAVTYGKTERMSFARHEEIQSMPNLLEIQKNSYKWFLEEGQIGRASCRERV